MTVPTPPGGALVQDTRLCSSFTLGGVQLLTPAWFADVRPLIGSPKPRGSNVVIPGVAGTTAYPRRATSTQQSLTIPITGYVTSGGSPNADPWAGLITNIYALRAVCDPVGTGNGARTATLTLAGGVTKTGLLQPEGLEIGDMAGPVCIATFTYTLPNGALA